MIWLESAANFMNAKGANDCRSPFPHTLKPRFSPWPHYSSSSLPISSPVGNWQAGNYEALGHQICMSIYFQTQHRLRNPSLLLLYSALVCPPLFLQDMHSNLKQLFFLPRHELSWVSNTKTDQKWMYPVIPIRTHLSNTNEMKKLAAGDRP